LWSLLIYENFKNVDIASTMDAGMTQDEHFKQLIRQIEETDLEETLTVLD